MKKNVDLSLIRTDGGTQMRAELSKDVYLEYRERFLAGADFPPVDLFHDGSTYWLADGFHRFYGAREAKLKQISANVHNGTQRDAVLFAVHANQTNGLRRSNADKRNAVTTLLNDEEWVKWSDRKIAEEAGVGVDLVGTIRKQLSENDSSPAAKTKDAPKVGKDGKKRKPPAPKTQKATESKPAPAVDDDPIGNACDHEWEDGACKRCKMDEPAKPRGKPSGGITYDPSEWETPASEVKDALGNSVPAELLDVFRAADEFAEQMKALTAVKAWVNRIVDMPAGKFLSGVASACKTDIDNARAAIKHCKPHTVCPRCKNKLPKVANCEACRHMGFVTAEVLDRIPKDLR